MQEFLEKKVEEIMNARLWDLPIVEENAPIKVVLVVLIGRCYTWVVKDIKSMEIAGIITEHDALGLLHEYNEKMKAKNIMSSRLIMTYPEEKIKDAIDKMVKNGYRRMPVVKDKKLVGEITLRHLIEKMYSAFFQ